MYVYVYTHRTPTAFTPFDFVSHSHAHIQEHKPHTDVFTPFCVIFCSDACRYTCRIRTAQYHFQTIVCYILFACMQVYMSNTNRTPTFSQGFYNIYIYIYILFLAYRHTSSCIRFYMSTYASIVGMNFSIPLTHKRTHQFVEENLYFFCYEE